MCICMHRERQIFLRISRGLNWENKIYKLKGSIPRQYARDNQTIAPRLHSIHGMHVFALDVCVKVVLNLAPKVILQLPWFELPQLVIG